MNKAFSLIELMISVILLTIASTSLYKISINTIAVNDRVTKDTNLSLYSSIPALIYTKKLHKKTTNLYDALNYKKLQNDELIRILKNTKITYNKQKEEKIDLGFMCISGI